MNEQAWAWAESLGHWALAWTLVVVTVALWMRIARPKGAALRYAGWLLATFAGLALIPPVVGLGPRVSWTDALALVRRTPAPAVGPVVRFPSWFEGMPAAPANKPVEVEAHGPAPASSSRAGAPSPELHPEDRPAEARGPWFEVALALWGAGVLAFAVRLGRDAIRVRALLEEADGDVPGALGADLEPVRVDLGLRRRVRVLVHPEIAAPMCVGLLRPSLLWPTAENCPMTAPQRRASLVHELAHLRHGDDWVALLAEVWRCLAWFYLPVHVTIDRLRREREYWCDDVASSRWEGPEGYARWLLDLAPLRVEPPRLASSLLGGADLAARVRRLLDGDARSKGPLSRRQVAMLGTLAVGLLVVSGSVRLVGFLAHAGEAERADAPLPEITPDALAAKIESAWKDYASGRLEVAFEEERGTDRYPSPPRQEGKAPTLKYPGRFQFASDGRRWRAEFDAMMPSSGLEKIELVPDRWVTGFDGERHYNWTVGRNEVTLGDSRLGARDLQPRELFWHQSKGLIESLKDRATTIARKTVDGVRCYVIEARTKNDSGDWRSEYVISPRQSYLMTELSFSRNGFRYLSHRLEGVRQAEQGLWFPGRIVSEWLSVSKSGAPQLMSRRSMKVVRFEPAKAVAREDFALKVPFNATVRDLTQGFSYANDPWWPEVGGLLREEFHWPHPDLSGLRNLSSHCDGKIEGQPAPAVEASAWIHSGPIDWASYRGKVVLIHFLSTAVEAEAAAAIRTLAGLYREAGLRVVTVAGSREDPEAVRQFVKELHLEQPVAIDRPKDANGFGATMQAFGMTYDSSVFLVDHLGKVRQVKDGPDGFTELLVRLLRDAGARDVPAPDLSGFRQIPREESNAVDRAFQDWVKQADDGGSLIGTIVDAEGRPVSNAQVRVRAETRILMGSASHFVTYSRTPHAAVTGENGMFQFLNLCKGNYDIRISAPGFATIERRALIEPKLGEVTFEAVMGQGDTIGGRLIDDQGRPIPDAEATLSERKIPHPDGTVTTTFGFLEMKTTDTQGRFQFQKLPEGDYTLTLQGEGFSKEVVKNVRSGANNLELTLRRTRP